MTTVTVLLVPVGPGNWSPITLTYSPRLRTEQPAAVEWYRGRRVTIDGKDYRVSRVTST